MRRGRSAPSAADLRDLRSYESLARRLAAPGPMSARLARDPGVRAIGRRAACAHYRALARDMRAGA